MEKCYQFSTDSQLQEWRIVNDGVMGGVSTSAIVRNGEGIGLFSGHVSLANYGGFASVQRSVKIEGVNTKKYILVRVKGDKKAYEFRLKSNLSQREAYVHRFVTSGEWETVKLPIADFYPQFRGQRLEQPNFGFSTIEQISFLIANKKEEDFALLIDWIGLE